MRSEVGDVWKVVTISNHGSIEPAVITTQPPTSMFLLDHVESKGSWRSRTADNPCFFHGGIHCLGIRKLGRIKATVRM